MGPYHNGSLDYPVCGCPNLAASLRGPQCWQPILYIGSPIARMRFLRSRNGCDVCCYRRYGSDAGEMSPYIRVNAAPITMSSPSSNHSEIFSPATTPAFIHLIVFFGSNTHTTFLVTCILFAFSLIPTCPINIKQDEHFCYIGTRDPSPDSVL